MALASLSTLSYLAHSELQRRHAGSAGGVVWTILAPMALIGAMWVALDIGLGMRESMGPRYGASLIIGMVAWLAFADSVSDATASIVRNPHLVKKIVFPVELLPLASVAASYMIHLAVLGALICVLLAMGQLDLRLAWTLPVWALLSIVLSVSVALLVSGLNVLVRDMQALIPLVVSFLFWLTPIIWPLEKLDPAWRNVATCNPMAVVVEGYKSALTGAPLPFELSAVVLAFVTTSVLCAAACMLFATLRPSFPDSL